MSNLIQRVAALACTAAACVSAQAAPIYYTAENMAPNQSASGNPLTERNKFLAQLSTSSTEDFDTDTTGTGTPRDLEFVGTGGPFTARLTQSAPNGLIIQTPSSGGRFNTTGSENGPTFGKWLSVSQSFNIDFGQNLISAFGFYATDVGDRTTQISVLLTDVNNVQTSRALNNTEGTVGGLLFWGFVDAANQYKSISILLNQRDISGGFDTVGFDDFVASKSTVTVTNPVSEPGSLALLAACALGAAGASRRRA